MAQFGVSNSKNGAIPKMAQILVKLQKWRNGQVAKMAQFWKTGQVAKMAQWSSCKNSAILGNG
jgi:hypothetical protein